MDHTLKPKTFDAEPNSPDALQRWNHWFRTFNNYLKSVESTNPDKLETLIHFLDHSVYHVVADCPDYDSAIDVLKKLYVRPRSIIYARHLLATCRQEEGQDIDQFVLKLKSLAKSCDFQSVSALEHNNESVCDALIAGLQSTTIREKLLAQHELSLDEAHELARSLELAHKQSQTYANHQSLSCSTTPSVLPNQVPPLPQPQRTDISFPVSASTRQTCYFCGYDRHTRSKCPAREATCKACGKLGHFQRVCRSKSTQHHVGSTVGPVLSSLFTAAAPGCLSRSVTNILVNGVTLQALIDTGSSASYISSRVVQTYNWKLHTNQSVITMASTSLSCPAIGFCLVSIRYNDYHYDRFKLTVLPDLCSDILLGHDFLSLHNKLEIPFGGERGTLTVCGLTAVRVESPPLFANLSPDCKPIAVKSRRHSPDDEQFIRSEVMQLLKDGIIEPSNSPWRAQVLVTKNSSHKKRMVIDYSQTINRFTYLDAYPLPRLDQMIESISRFSIFSTLDLKSAYHQIPIADYEKPYTAFEAGGSLYQFRRIPFGVTNGVACFQRTIDKILKTEGVRDTFAYIDNVTVCGRTKSEHDRNLNTFLQTAKKYGIIFNDSKSVIASEEICLLGYQVSKGVIKPDPERMRPIRQLPPPHDVKSQQRVVGMFAYYAHWIPAFSDKINPLTKNRVFPLPAHVNAAFENLKKELENAMVTTIDYDIPLVVETDASDVAIAASLSQNNRPVAFFSRSLTPSERNHSSVEKEAYAIVEAVRKWRHYLLGRHFKLITDQRSVAFMYNGTQKGKVKNDKIQRWKIELSAFSFDITYRPGNQNAVADTLSRDFCSSLLDTGKLKELHCSLCHPGVTRLNHFVRSKNLPYSIDDIKRIVSTCETCCELKPRFCNASGRLIKATQPFERLSVDFKGPLPSNTRNRYLLTLIDEYSRFPFAFPCPDMSSSTVINCLSNLFSIFGMPAYIHSDRGTSFMSSELSKFLLDKGVASSHTTAYNPQCNGQVERLNGTLWKTICLALKTKKLPITHWEMMLPDALHSIRSLLCTSTNCTPHERLFLYTRRSTNGASIPTWLTIPGPVYLKRTDRTSKYDSLVEEVQLVKCDPQYAHIVHADGRNECVNLRRLAPKQNDPSNILIEPAQHSTPVADNQLDADVSGTYPDNSDSIGMHDSEAQDSTPSTDVYSQLLHDQQRTRPYILRNREA